MTTSKLITKRDLRKVFFRSFPMEWTWNYEKQQNLGYTYAMIPIIEKLYKDKPEEKAAALQRHLEFFNTTPHMVTLILGISTAMEEENALDENFDTSSINSVKAGLMGPLAGIGDSFMWGTLRIIATGIGTSLAMNGNILGPILLVHYIPLLKCIISAFPNQNVHYTLYMEVHIWLNLRKLIKTWVFVLKRLDWIKS